MALVYIRPDADTTDGSWVNESASNTNLFASVDETSASDSDYIRSSNNPANDIVKLRLSNFGVTVIEPMTVRYRFKKVVAAADILSLKVRLVEGNAPGTTIAEWEESDISATYVDGEQTLTTAQFDSIGDFNDLYLEFEGITGALIIVGAYYLLTGETSGFSFDATTYDTVTAAEYVGGPVGGTLAVKGHSTNYTNVALDSGNIVQSGTSPKLVHWNEAPWVRWTPHNLQTESQDISAGYWANSGTTKSTNSTTAPDGTTTADTITASSGSSVHTVDTSTGVNITPGFIYTCSVYFKSGTNQYANLLVFGSSNGVGIVIDLTGGTITGTTSVGSDFTLVSSDIESVGSGWYRCIVTTVVATDTFIKFALKVANSTSTSWNYSWSAAGTETIYAWGAQLNRGPIATSYLATTTTARYGIPQGYDAIQDQFGILVETEATNLLTQSETFTHTDWTTENGSTTANDTTAPDGSITAEKFAADSSSNQHSLYTNGTTGLNGAGTVSVYLKMATYRYANLSVSKVGGLNWVVITVDLQDGTITQLVDNGDPTDASAAIVPVGDGWFRCSVTATFVNSVYYTVLSVPSSGTPTNGDYGRETWDAAGGESFYVWGIQLETSAAPTSYVPRISATATRAKDLVACATSTIPFSATAGTVWSEAMSPFTEYDYQAVFAIDDTTANNYLLMYRETTGTGSSAAFNIVTSGGTQLGTIAEATAVWDKNVLGQGTYAWAANDVEGTFNGSTPDVDTTVSLPTVTTFRMGTLVDDLQFNGFIYRLVYVPRRVT